MLGHRDQNLRLIRDALGVKILARRGDLRVTGDDDRVTRAIGVFQGLRDHHRGGRVVDAGVVADLLDRARLGFPEPDDSEAHGSARPAGAAANANANPDSAWSHPVDEIRLGGRAIRARTEGQLAYFRALAEKELVFCVGPAGTGKTYLAVAQAVSLLRSGRIKKIVLVRPAVEAGEHLGFLPGDLEAKINPYLRPLLDALHDLMEFGQIRRYMGNDLIEIAPLAYMRGRTLNDAYIILDEGQNATIPQMKMFLTRMGQNARIVVTGDTTQVDLPPTTPSGLADAVARLRHVPRIGVVELGRGDIVRHPLVQAIVNAYESDPPPANPTPIAPNQPANPNPNPPAPGNGDPAAAALNTATAADLDLDGETAESVQPRP